MRLHQGRGELFTRTLHSAGRPSAPASRYAERMGRKKRTAAAAGGAAPEQAMRDQEVLRANRELAAYFKGRRTEREARAALKIIKAFVRDRERREPKDRAPLPG